MCESSFSGVEARSMRFHVNLRVPQEIAGLMKELWLGFHTLPKFNSSPLKSYLPNRKVVFQPQFFRGYVKLRGCNPFIRLAIC